MNTCFDHAGKRCKALGIGLDESFSKWKPDMLESAYRGAKNQVIGQVIEGFKAQSEMVRLL